MVSVGDKINEKGCISMRKTPIDFLLKIFLTFFKIGMFTFGGGFAMIPLMEKEIVERQGWLEREKFIDAISLTQTAPGAVAINLAIFLGYNMAGFVGAVVATIGVALPSFLIILAIAISFSQFRNSFLVEQIFNGIRPAVVALIAYAGVKLSRTLEWTTFLVGILIFTVISRIVLGLSPIILILIAAILGLINYKFTAKNKETEEERGDEVADAH